MLGDREAATGPSARINVCECVYIIHIYLHIYAVRRASSVAVNRTYLRASTREYARMLHDEHEVAYFIPGDYVALVWRACALFE